VHGVVFSFLCQPLLVDRLLAWESRSLVCCSINSCHANFDGRKSSVVRHLLSAVLVDSRLSLESFLWWTVVCRWSAFFGESFGYFRIMSVVTGGKASAIGQLLSVFCRRRSIFWFVVLIPYHTSCQWLQASVVRELLYGGWICSFASCQLVAGRQAFVW